MAEITAIFWDVGGVLLTNGWDREGRRLAAAQFVLDAEEFEERHGAVVAAFETGHLDLAGYLERTVFHRPRAFSPEKFTTFMLAQSAAHPAAFEVLERLWRARRYLLATLNNESLELNLHRIRQFHLQRYFTVFVSSCFLGVKKPDEAIYRLALQLTQRPPEAVVYIDDRSLNLECARRLGMRTLHYQGARQLEGSLREAGVEF